MDEAGRTRLAAGRYADDPANGAALDDAGVRDGRSTRVILHCTSSGRSALAAITLQQK